MQDPQIKKSWECLDLAFSTLNDGYTAALLAYAFALDNHPCINKAIKILNRLAIEEGTCHVHPQVLLSFAL